MSIHPVLMFVWAVALISAPSKPRLQIAVLRHIPLDERIGQALQVVPDSDGTFLIADYSNGVVWRTGEDGKVRLSYGRGGGGPGEFRMLYRVAAGPAGSVYAFDASPAAVSIFTASGAFVMRRELSLMLKSVGSFVVLPGGGVGLTGVAVRGGTYSDSAVHAFDDSLRHLRSFGPVPVTLNPQVLQWWGAGGLSISRRGTLLFTRRLPYEVYEYSADGNGIRVIQAPFTSLGSPDEALTVTETDHATRVERRPGAVTVPITAYELSDGTILSGRVRGDSTTFDLFSSAGGIIASSPMMKSYAIIGRGPDPLTLWVADLVNESPCIELWRLSVPKD